MVDQTGEYLTNPEHSLSVFLCNFTENSKPAYNFPLRYEAYLRIQRDGGTARL